MDKMKKGISSLSMLLLGSALIIVVLSIALFSNSLVSTYAALARLERINFQSDSSEYGLKNLFMLGVVNVTKQGNNITFEENLTLPAEYASDLSRFRQFIEEKSEDGELNTSLNMSDAQRPKMYILPQFIAVDHPANNRITFTPQNTSSSVGELKGYNLTVEVNQNVPNIHWTSLSEVVASDPNALFFSIKVIGNVQTIYDTRYLHKHEFSRMTVTQGNVRPAVEIAFSSPGAMNITYTAGNDIGQYTNLSISSIVLLNSTSFVELGQNIINVSYGRESEKLAQVVVLED